MLVAKALRVKSAEYMFDCNLFDNNKQNVVIVSFRVLSCSDSGIGVCGSDENSSLAMVYLYTLRG